MARISGILLVLLLCGCADSSGGELFTRPAQSIGDDLDVVPTAGSEAVYLINNMNGKRLVFTVKRTSYVRRPIVESRTPYNSDSKIAAPIAVSPPQWDTLVEQTSPIGRTSNTPEELDGPLTEPKQDTRELVFTDEEAFGSSDLLPKFQSTVRWLDLPPEYDDLFFILEPGQEVLVGLREYSSAVDGSIVRNEFRIGGSRPYTGK